jgi:flavin-dependent dehydrogenase
LAIDQADIVIIGAGPAGSAAAIELARAGRRVVMVERKHFPRDKACGGCLSGKAVTYLRRLLPGQALPGSVAEQLTFQIGQCRIISRPSGRTRLVIRSEFDAFLANTAAAAGAEVHYGATARLVRTESGWNVDVDGVHLRAGSILVAGGLAAGRMLPCAGRAGMPRMAAQSWVQPVDANADLPRPGQVEMHWLVGGYIGLATPDRGRCVVGIVADEVGGGETPWTRLHRLNPDSQLWSRLAEDAPRRFRAVGAAGFPWTPRCLGMDNVLLVGDAAGYVEPFSGEGMGQALCSAASAAAAVLGAGDMQRAYAELMGRGHRFANSRLRWVGRQLRSPLVRRLAARPPLLPGWLVRMMIDWIHVRAKA